MENETKETPVKLNLYQKVSCLRKDVLTRDWTDDKMFTLPGGKGGYPYLSADKVKKTIAPLFAKHGIELRMEFKDLEYRPPIGNMSQHWTVRLEVSLIDTETGERETSCVYGEAGDSGDKGVSKAQTCAVKQWVFSEFFIADGIDPDASATISTGGSFYKKTPEEQEEVKSKVLEQSLKPKAKPAVPAKPVEKVDNAPEKAPEAEAPKEDKPETKFEEKFTPTGPQLKTIQRIADTYEKRLKANEISADEYNAMSEAKALIASATDVSEFVKRFRVTKVGV